MRVLQSTSRKILLTVSILLSWDNSRASPAPNRAAAAGEIGRGRYSPMVNMISTRAMMAMPMPRIRGWSI